MVAKKKETVKVYKNPSFRRAYDKPKRVRLKTYDARTEQHHQDECDVNKILSQYIKKGVDVFTQKHDLHYADVTTGNDYHEAMNTIAKANSMFADLPSKIRNDFDNDPALFLDFVGDPENIDYLVERGLAKPESKERLAPALQEEDAVPLKEETASDKSVKDASDTVAT